MIDHSSKLPIVGIYLYHDALRNLQETGFEEWEWLSRLSNLFIIFEVVVSLILVVTSLETAGWIPKSIPLPPLEVFNALLYVFVILAPPAIVIIPGLDPVRRVMTGRWYREGGKFWLVQSPPRQEYPFHNRRVTFGKRVAEAVRTEQPKTRQVLLDEIRPLLKMVCSAGYSQDGGTTKSIRALLDLMDKYFDDELQETYVEFLSIISGNREKQIVEEVRSRFRDRVEKLWADPDLDKIGYKTENMTNLVNILGDIEPGGLAYILSLMKEVIHHPNKNRYDAFCASFRDRFLLYIRWNPKKWREVNDFILTEMANAESVRDAQALDRSKALRALSIGPLRKDYP